jgi:hypothetical protein
LKVKGFWANNIWLIPVIIVVLAGLAVLLILLLRGGGGVKSRGLKIRMYIDNTPVNREPMSVKGEEPIYIVTDKASFNLSKEKVPEAVAELKLVGGDLKLNVTKKKGFPLLDPLPEGSLIGEKFRVKNISGGYYSIYFRIA